MLNISNAIQAPLRLGIMSRRYPLRAYRDATMTKESPMLVRVSIAVAPPSLLCLMALLAACSTAPAGSTRAPATLALDPPVATPATQPSTRPALAATTEPTAATQPAASEPPRPPAPDRLTKLFQTLRTQFLDTGIPRITYDPAGHIVAVLLSADAGNDDNVRALADLPDLAAVRIICSDSSISADALADLSKLKNLRELMLHYATRDFSAEHGAAVARLTNLRTLIINYARIESDGLAPLAKLPHLQKLTIGWSRQLSDADLTPLANFPALEDLDLSYTGVSDDCLGILATLPCLRKLHARRTDITVAGVGASGLDDRIDVTDAQP